MKRIIFLLASIAVSHAFAADPSAILVVREMNPWRMVIGSDSAKFALYDDGSVIYQTSKPTAERPFLRRTVNDPKKASEKLLGFDPEKLEAEYVLSSATDQISTTIWTSEKNILIYGDWRKPLTFGFRENRDLKAIEERELKMWKSLPKKIRAFLARIEKAREKKGDPWLPDHIEVMLWPYEYAPDASILWPSKWPDLQSKMTRKQGENLYVVSLPSERFPELRKLISTRKEKGAMLINGKKMAISYRFPFPDERKWME